VCGADAAPLAAVRARLGEALARIGGASCEFWPGLPATATAADRALPIADYWRQRAVGEIALAAEVEETSAQTGKLLVNLSTINGFIPAFAARQVP